MRFILWLTVWLRRIVVLVILFGIALAVPVLWVEFACKGTPLADDYTPVLPEEARRIEGRTYSGYPATYVTNAYADYADTLNGGDPHDYAFFGAIKGYWSSLCTLKKTAEAHGGMDADIKKAAYIDGVGLTADMATKAAYEETIGRIMTLIRGEAPAPLDLVEAQQAERFSATLRNRSWDARQYGEDASALWAAKTNAPRDWERAIALNGELRVKGFVASLVAPMLGDDPVMPDTTHVIVTDMPAETLGAVPGVQVVGPRGQGTEIAVSHGAAFTPAMLAIARQGGTFVEIAGNDDILLTISTPSSSSAGLTPLLSFEKPDGSYRHLLETKVWGLSNRLRELEGRGVGIDEIHDY